MTEHDPDQERLRPLLEDAVSDVEPAGGLDAIRGRTHGRPGGRRHPWLVGAAAAVAATAATIVAVNLAGDQSPTSSPLPGPAASASTGAAQTPASPAVSPPQLRSVPVYYVGQTTHGPRLYREFHQVPADRDAATQAVGSAVGVAPEDPDYGSPWSGTGTSADSVTHQGGTITVDLATDYPVRERPGGMSADEASMAVEQVIYTAQAALQSRDPVQILVNGSHTDQVFGVPTAEPLAQGAESSTLAQVWIIDPAQGAEVASGFTVDGLAAAFEANVQWELKQGDTVVKKGFTTARECCTMAPYSFTVQAPPGDYTLVVHDEDASGGEGPGPWQDTKDITITP
jgi:hypothetical protein